MLHEAGYDYESIPALTISEIRRLVEGQRVHNEIKNMIRESNRAGGHDAALGRTVPREGDEKLLDNYADRLDETSASAGV